MTNSKHQELSSTIIFKKHDQYQPGSITLRQTSHKGAALFLICFLMMNTLPTAYGFQQALSPETAQPTEEATKTAVERSESSRLYEYPGLAYDMFTGNPRGETVDPGFKPKHVFELTYKNGFRTADGLFIAPDQLSIVTDMSCSFSSSSNTYPGMSSYQRDLRIAAGLEAEYEGKIVKAAFALNAEFNHMKNTLEEEEKVAVVTEAKCLLYHTSLMESANLTSDFKEAIAKAYKTKSFDRFVDEWGTHFAHEVEFGARAIQKSLFTRKDYQELSSFGIDVSASVTASGWGASGNISAALGYSSAQASKFSSTNREVRESYIGLAPPENGEARTWLANIKNSNPVPIEFKLTPIVNVLTKEYFGDEYQETQLSDIKKLLSNAIFLRSAKLNYVAPADDRLGMYSQKVVETDFVGTKNNTFLSGFRINTDRKALLITKEITVSWTDECLENIVMKFADGGSELEYKGYSSPPSLTLIKDTFEVPNGRSISKVKLFTRNSCIQGIEFLLDNGVSSQHFGNYGEEVTVPIQGHIVDMEINYAWTMASINRIYGLKFAVARKTAGFIEGFRQLKTDKAGKDMGEHYEDPDKPLLEFRTKKLIVQAGAEIDGIQAILSMDDLEIENEFHGGLGGSRKELNLARNEYFTTVSVWTTTKNGITKIAGIQFNTSAGQSVSYGTCSGTADKTWTINGFITGFYGFKGTTILSLGIKYTSAF